MISFVPAGATMAITSDEVNYLVYRYLQESGAHSSAVLCNLHRALALAAELLGMRTSEQAQEKMLRLRPRVTTHCLLTVLYISIVGRMYLGVNTRTSLGGPALTE